MMTPEEREVALQQMRDASNAFYRSAICIGNHPFIEFTGLMNEYIKACEQAHRSGIDFSECNTHSGKHLPMPSYMVEYVNEKLECIYTGRSVMPSDATVDEFLAKMDAMPVDPERVERIRKVFLEKLSK